MNPLLNVLLGVVALKERLTRVQLVAVGLAVLGVLNMTIEVGALPWVSLALAGSFALYGLLRKTVAVASMEGLFVEVLLLTPFAVAWLVWLDLQGTGHFLRIDATLDLLLVFAGPMTTFPLIWFASAARRLRLAMLGFFQYIAPSLHFALAVFVYGEAFTEAHLVTFALIWTAVAVVSLDSLRRLRLRPAAG